MAGEYLPPILVKLNGDPEGLIRAIADAKAAMASLEGKTVHVRADGVTNLEEKVKNAASAIKEADDAIKKVDGDSKGWDLRLRMLGQDLERMGGPLGNAIRGIRAFSTGFNDTKASGFFQKIGDGLKGLGSDAMAALKDSNNLFSGLLAAAGELSPFIAAAGAALAALA